MQLPEYAAADQLFTPDYAYFSSTSSSMCSHAEKFVEKAISLLELNSDSYVVELASNDGYLLQHMISRDIPCLGIEPTHDTAEVARSKGIDTIEAFFGSSFSEKLEKADLIIANNVLAHVPDINDFIAGIANLLKPSGQVSIEFPHLLQLIKDNLFDTIYHEHYSYLSLGFVKRLSKSVGLDVVNVECISTHGGSLRVWLAHQDAHHIDFSVERLLAEENAFGLNNLKTYTNFQHRAQKSKFELLNFLLKANDNSQKVFGYGAAAKGNTLLNYAGVSSDLLMGVADKARSKQGKYLPGSHIPVVSPEQLELQSPDYILLFPWNLREEISRQLPCYSFVTAIPDLHITSPLRNSL